MLSNVLTLGALALPAVLAQSELLSNVTIFTPPSNYTVPRTLYARTLLLNQDGETANELPQAVGNYSAGTVLLAVNSIPNDLRETQIDVYASTDKGYTWTFISHVAHGGLLFQWRASDHFGYAQSYEPIKSATEQDSWDWYHMNNDAGDYLVSSRHLRTIAKIDGRTGDVLWQLDSRSNSFRDLSGGGATQYIGQHDAHWAADSNYTAITFFDNRADWTYHTEKKSWGTRVQLDLEAMTATLTTQYKHSENVYSVSQGSYQTLPNGNVLLGYGNNGVVTEFSPEGEVMCDTYFGPWKDWTSGNVQSYRNLKFNWTGTPNTRPSLALESGALYMSWLGSTEVRSWLLQHASYTDGGFRELMRVPKDGFETRLRLGAGMEVRQYVQVTALDKDHRILAVSDPVNIGAGATVLEDQP